MYERKMLILIKRRPLMHHDDVIEWKYFSRYWPFVRGIHRGTSVPVDQTQIKDNSVLMSTGHMLWAHKGASVCACVTF